jgi:hypothetical protein
LLFEQRAALASQQPAVQHYHRDVLLHHYRTKSCPMRVSNHALNGDVALILQPKLLPSSGALLFFRQWRRHNSEPLVDQPGQMRVHQICHCQPTLSFSECMTGPSIAGIG